MTVNDMQSWFAWFLLPPPRPLFGLWPRGGSAEEGGCRGRFAAWKEKMRLECGGQGVTSYLFSNGRVFTDHCDHLASDSQLSF